MAKSDQSNASPTDSAREQLKRMDLSILQDAAIALGCKDVPKHAVKEDLVELIINCPNFRSEVHLDFVTSLESLIRDQALNKMIDDRFDEQVKPLTRMASRIQGVFVTIGTVASVIVAVSTLSGYNLNAKLEEQQAAFEKNREALKEELSDLHKVREENRRDRRDEIRRTATLERYTLQAEIIGFQKVFERILSLSLQLENQTLKKELERIKPDVKRWKRLRRAALEGVKLETKREWEIIAMQIEFIEAMERFVEWREAGDTGWTPTHTAFVKLDKRLTELQGGEDLRYLELRDLLERVNQALDPASDGVEGEKQWKDELQTDLVTQLKKDLNALNTRLGSRVHDNGAEFSGLVTKALAYTNVMLAQIERRSPSSNKKDIERAIEHAKQAIRWDSTFAQAYGELAWAYLEMAEYVRSTDFDKTVGNAVYANESALEQTVARVYPRDALILKNNLAYVYLSWAGHAKEIEIAINRIDLGLEALEDIDDSHFDTVGTVGEVVRVTKAELLIAKLFAEVADEKGFYMLLNRWENKECATLEQPLADLIKESAALEQPMADLMYQASERVSDIYQQLLDAGDFGKGFFRRKAESELGSSSPYLCAFAKLKLVSGADSGGIRGEPAVSPEERERDLRLLQRKINDMFQLIPGVTSEPQGPSTDAASS